MHEIEMVSIPENLRQEFEGVNLGGQSQFHSASPRMEGKGGSVFYGTQQEPKGRILHFFRSVDSGIASRLKGHNAPLIVATVGYLFPIYQTANTYPHLAKEGIAGNPDLLEPEALRAAVWKIVERHLDEVNARAFTTYKEHVNTERTSSNLRKVFLAAEHGQVRFLFVPQEAERWGSFVPPDILHVHSQKGDGDDELLNLTTISTLRHGGQVYVVPKTYFPDGADVAAVFRF